MAINWTVGAGGDYPTWQLALVAVKTLGALPSDVVITQVSDVTEVVSHDSTGTAQLNGFTLTLTTNNPHLGSPTKGWVTYLAGGVSFFQSTKSGLGSYVIDGLYFQRVPGAGATNDLLVSSIGDPFPLPTVPALHIVRNCLFKGDAKLEYAMDIGPVNVRIHFYNNKIWNLSSGLILEINTGGGGHFTESKIFENCTIYGCANNVELNCCFDYEATFRNIVSVVSDNPDWQHNSLDISTWSCYNSADEDGSLAGIPFGATVEGLKFNIVPADEFASLVDTEDDFLFLKAGSKSLDIAAVPQVGIAPLPVKFSTNGLIYTKGSQVLADSGIAPTLTTEDISGESIPDEGGNYPIGCHSTIYA